MSNKSNTTPLHLKSWISWPPQDTWIIWIIIQYWYMYSNLGWFPRLCFCSGTRECRSFHPSPWRQGLSSCQQNGDNWDNNLQVAQMEIIGYSFFPLMCQSLPLRHTSFCTSCTRNLNIQWKHFSWPRVCDTVSQSSSVGILKHVRVHWVQNVFFC